MRNVIAFTVVLLCGTVGAASASWNGIILSNGGLYPNGVRELHFSSDIHGKNGEYAWIHSFFYGYNSNGSHYLKHNDFSYEPDNPTFNWWILATCGDIVSDATFDTFTHIEEFYCIDPNAPYTGGTLIENPDDFYMAFKVSEVLLDGSDYVAGQTWYGWVHVSIDENLEMTLLGDGINLDGGAVTVGVTPEPVSGLLLLVGGAVLALRRRKNLV